MKKDKAIQANNKDSQKCSNDSKCTSEDVIGAVKSEMPDDIFFFRLEELFKAMGSQTRLKIIYALMKAEELCVEHLGEAVDMSISAVSHQLKGLRQLRLVKTRKQGQHVYYSLDDEHIALLFHTGSIHLSEEDE